MRSNVKRAYFHALAKRELYVELPIEDAVYQEGFVGRLRLALYGTRDAAALWQECLSDHLIACGFTRGISNRCVFYNVEMDLRCLVHGDDCATVGSLDSLAWMRANLEEGFDVKIIIVGHSVGVDVVSEGNILN